MPTYEYRCKKCSQCVAFTMAISEHGKGDLDCSQDERFKVRQAI